MSMTKDLELSGHHVEWGGMKYLCSHYLNINKYHYNEYTDIHFDMRKAKAKIH